MSLLNLYAVIACDGCGCQMQIEIDPATDTRGWDLFDIAEDACRGGASLTKINGAEAKAGFTSVQDGDCLCPICTKGRDEVNQ